MSASAGTAHHTNVETDGGAWAGPTYKWTCLTCGESEDAFIKRRYAEAEAHNHRASRSGEVPS